MPGRRDEQGVSLVELLLVLSIGALVGLGALGALSRAREHAQGLGAARTLAIRIAGVRLDALRRGATTGLLFREVNDGYVLEMVVDENGNGLRAEEIANGVDRSLGPAVSLSDDFPGVRFAIGYAMPPVDGEGATLSPGDDPLQIGRSSLLAFGPAGTGTSGTLYLLGPGRRQFAVRVFGPTGRVRLFEFRPGTGEWVAP